MIDIVSGFSIASVFIWFAVPRLFAITDSVEARHRLKNSHLVTPSQTSLVRISSKSRGNPAPILEFAALCDSLARATRSGASAHDAILATIQRHQFQDPCWVQLCNDIMSLQPCDTALLIARQSAMPNSRDAQCLSLLESAMVHGNFLPNALDHASSVLRDRAACSAELAVAASQAQLSARLLSALPFLLLAGALVISPQFRTSIGKPLVVFLLICGIILNRLGWRWISSLITRAVRTEPDGIGELTEHLCVSLRAGLSMIHACERWRSVSVTGNVIADLISTGAPLEEALIPLTTAHQISGKNLGHTIVEAERDGLPIVDTVTRLATDHRIEQRRLIDTKIRQLPTRLSIPLVMCVLPSFLLLSVAPLIIVSLGQLSVSLPSITQ